MDADGSCRGSDVGHQPLAPRLRRGLAHLAGRHGGIAGGEAPANDVGATAVALQAIVDLYHGTHGTLVAIDLPSGYGRD